jgi:hypothetical protein
MWRRICNHYGKGLTVCMIFFRDHNKPLQHRRNCISFVYECVYYIFSGNERNTLPLFFGTPCLGRYMLYSTFVSLLIKQDWEILSKDKVNKQQANHHLGIHILCMLQRHVNQNLPRRTSLTSEHWNGSYYAMWRLFHQNRRQLPQ